MRYFTILTLLFLLLVFSSCARVDRAKNYVEVDHVKLPLDACMETQKGIMGKATDPKQFCECLLPKLYEEVKDDPKKLEQLKNGQIDQLGKKSAEKLTKSYEDCLAASATGDSTAHMSISPKMAENMKASIKRELTGSDIEKSNDLDKYCDCLLDVIRKDFTVTEIMDSSFSESEKLAALKERCLQSTKKK